jgi:prepilin-type N-terminal cleavage/methylation domain-containing protein
MRIHSSRRGGFTLVEMMIVVAIIGLLAGIAIPNFVKARSTSQSNACINNLRQLDGAVQEFALENNRSASAAVTSANVLPYLGRTGGVWPTCPASGVYGITTVAQKPTCSLSAIGHVLSF